MLKLGALTELRIHGTYVPVEEPSTASDSNIFTLGIPSPRLNRRRNLTATRPDDELR
jgi:hypothetical protein